jgi:NAD(P)-dependent dehydrogenase (short-subunit alcohol dehydrogenase family)
LARVAIKLAQEGANIAINYFSRDEDALNTEKAVQQEGVQCVLVKGDVSVPESVSHRG